MFWSWHHWGATGGCASGSASPWPPGRVAGVAVRGWLSQLFAGSLLSTSEQRSLLCIPLKCAEPARTQLRAQSVPEDATIVLPPCTSQGRVPAPEGCCSPRRDAQHSTAKPGGPAGDAAAEEIMKEIAKKKQLWGRRSTHRSRRLGVKYDKCLGLSTKPRRGE